MIFSGVTFNRLQPKHAVQPRSAPLSVKSLVLIRQPTAKDFKQFLAAVRDSCRLHRGWVSPPRTRESYFDYLRKAHSETHRGFLVIHRQSQGFVGVININHIIRGNLRGAFLGYYAFGDFAGLGLMRDGLHLVLAHAFHRLRLHRLEANIQPDNRASLGLVRSCGFVREGYSRRYLKVGGRWRDHERWAVVAEDFTRRNNTKSHR